MWPGPASPAFCLWLTYFGLFHDYYALTLAALATPAAVLPGDLITYTLTVTNTGTITATRLTLASTISACPAGLDREAEVPGWDCAWEYAQGCLYARCRADLAPLAPAAAVTLTQTIRTALSAPVEAEAVRAEFAIVGEAQEQQKVLITPFARPPAGLAGSILVESMAEAVPDETITSIFVTATDVETGAQATTFVAPDGRYWLSGLSGGVYRLEVPHDIGPLACASSQPVTVTLRYGQQLTLDFLYRRMPLPVVLAFRAQTSAKGVHVEWVAEDEGQMEAYRVWRGPASTGPFRPVSGPIAPSGAGGRSLYTWLDARPGVERWYLLELSPSGRRIGPILALSGLRHRLYLPVLMADSGPPRP